MRVNTEKLKETILTRGEIAISERENIEKIALCRIWWFYNYYLSFPKNN